MRVSIPLPRRCERRTLPIELIPQRTTLFYSYVEMNHFQFFNY